MGTILWRTEKDTSTAEAGRAEKLKWAPDDMPGEGRQPGLDLGKKGRKQIQCKCQPPWPPLESPGKHKAGETLP